MKNAITDVNYRIKYLATKGGILSEKITVTKSKDARALAQNYIEFINEALAGDDASAIAGTTIWTVLDASFDTEEAAYTDGDTLDASFTINVEEFRQFLQSKEVLVDKEVPPPPVEEAPVQEKGVYIVSLPKDKFSLSLRDTPCDIYLPSTDMCNAEGDPILSDIPVSPGNLGGLIGRLPNGVKIKLLKDYVGKKKSYAEIETIGPEGFIGLKGFVDRGGLSLVKKEAAEAAAEKLDKAPMGDGEAPTVSKDDTLTRRSVHIDGEEYHSLQELADAKTPPQAWKDWVELVPHNISGEKHIDVPSSSSPRRDSFWTYASSALQL
ncbi:MAG TPA: hypothetical protein EYN08_06370 [Gammaproteobacteria bacterium]|nr:hypothetical protein [Gammaproteobacteria bacterium]